MKRDAPADATITSTKMEKIEERLDKFLWAIRVYKTRSEATEACKSGKVKVNDQEAKPSKDIKENDIIEVRKGSVHYQWRVLIPIGNRQGAKAVSQFAEDITPQEELDKLNAPFETIFVKRDRGTGRPTKKERRDLEKFIDW
jgi:ribosome-associated heat shock protein Hsp15